MFHTAMTVSALPDSRAAGRSAPFEAAMASYAPLSPEQLALVRECLGAPHAYPADAEIGRGESAKDHRPILIASGWAAVTATLEDGRRQIISLLIAGDILEPLLDLQPGLSITTLTAVTTVDASGVVGLLRDRLASDMRPLAEAWARL